MEKLQRLADGDAGSGALRLRMADSSSIRVRRHGAGAPRDSELPRAGTSRGSRIMKVRPDIDGNALAKAVLPTPGQAAGCTQAAELPAGLLPVVRRQSTRA